ADDGTRLWVDNQQLIDAWIPQPPTEWEGSIPLQAGKRYPIQLEFFEEGGGAVCQLSWSSNRITQSIIPRSQLYPAYITAVPADHQPASDVRVYPNPARDKIFVQHKNLVAGLKELSIHNDLGDLVMSRKDGLEKEETEINVVSLAKGIYWLQYVLENGVSGTVEFVKL
ncbi:MAG TPA: PA14 domain-containing protein, partial [Saprospiraceae bacterium]|nr:PA14 domain-containing protein [Saprospiraceae bacterium]